MDINTRFDGEKYETLLLWKTDDISLPNNRSMALKSQKAIWPETETN